MNWQQVTAALLALAAVDAIKAEQGLEKLSQAIKENPGWTAVFIIAGVAAVPFEAPLMAKLAALAGLATTATGLAK